MFTQKLSMDCTKEQYEKYLKDELLKMGYNDTHITFWENETIIINDTNGKIGFLGTFIISQKNTYERLYLGSFNAPLFLALAAMTDNPNVLGYGEYITDEKNKILRRNEWGEHSFVLFGYHKSTKEEIIDCFKNDISGNKEGSRYDATRAFAKYFCDNITKLRADITLNIIKNSANDAKEQLDAINLLKSKGYKILCKKETWEEV